MIRSLKNNNMKKKFRRNNFFAIDNYELGKLVKPYKVAVAIKHKSFSVSMQSILKF